MTHHQCLAAGAALALLTVAQPSPARAADLAGAWHGTVSNLAINIVVTPDHQFTETYVMNGAKTDVRGHIAPFAPGVVRFVVDDWTPKSHPVDKVVTYSERWVSPNEVVRTDVNKLGAITLLRVP